MFDKIIKYLALGGIAAVIPGVLSTFLPGITPFLLGAGLLVGSIFAVGLKIPFLAPAMGIAGGAMIAAPLLSGVVGNFMGNGSAISSETVIG